jgi:hypothetical protein
MPLHIGASLRKKLNSDQKRQLKSEALSEFVRQYARKAYPQLDPNDRRYDRQIAAKIRRMNPEELDALLRDGEQEETTAGLPHNSRILRS